MTRRVSKHGTTYTVGSQATFSSWEPRTCWHGDRCLHGGKIVLSGLHGLRFHFDDLTGWCWSAHSDCLRAFGMPTPPEKP